MQEVQERPGARDRALELDVFELAIDLICQRFDSGAKIAASGAVRSHGRVRPIACQWQDLCRVMLQALATAAPFGKGRPNFRRVHADLRIALDRNNQEASGLIPIVVQDIDGNTDATLTARLQSFMIANPGRIFYNAVPDVTDNAVQLVKHDQSPTDWAYIAKIQDPAMRWIKFRAVIRGHSQDGPVEEWPRAQTQSGELDTTVLAYGTLAQVAMTQRGAGNR